MIKSKKKRSLLLFFILPLAFAAYFGFLFLAPNFSPKNGNADYLLIRDDASFSDVVNQLNEKTKTLSISGFKQVSKILNYSNVKPGRYKISRGMNNLMLVRALKNGRQTPVNLKFNNVRTKEQLAGRLSQQLMVDSMEIFNLLNDKSFLSKYKLNPYNSIAIFLPNTYQIFWNTTAEKLFQRMYDESERFWTNERKNKAEKIPLTQSEVITLASIVDAETNIGQEKSVVAGLYINRLMKNMPLQADPTVIFAVGDFSIKRVTGAYTSFESPYNTYKHTGLPPGPIRIPDLKTIDAVLNYDKNDYIYMCAKETLNGEHNFAATWKEHSENAKRYQQALNERGIR